MLGMEKHQKAGDGYAATGPGGGGGGGLLFRETTVVVHKSRDFILHFYLFPFL